VETIKHNTMKKLFHIYYTSQGIEKTRCEYASNALSALNQAKEYFNNFGYGDESNFEILEV
jgi:hypothetical protein